MIHICFNRTNKVNVVFFLEDKDGKTQAIYELIDYGKRFNMEELETDGYKVCGMIFLNNSKEAYRYHVKLGKRQRNGEK